MYMPGSGNPAVWQQEAQEHTEILEFGRAHSLVEEGEKAEQGKLYQLKWEKRRKSVTQKQLHSEATLKGENSTPVRLQEAGPDLCSLMNRQRKECAGR